MRDSRRTTQLRQIVTHTACGALGVVAVTAVCYPLRADFPVVGCLYLLVVVTQSAFATFLSSAIVSVLSILCLDYFFVPPFFSLQIGRPIDGLGLLTFLVTALVITRLASRARQEARKAERRRKDLARLYELASRLVSVPPDVAVQRGYLGMFRSIFDLRAVCLHDGAASSATCDGECGPSLEELTRRAYAAAEDYSDDAAGIVVRCLAAGGTAIGAIGFEGLEDAGTVAGPLSMLAAAMVQRAHSFEQAKEAAAATQVEVLRTAILDAFAHQFKTPLAAILTAAGTLRETSPLSLIEEELVETIETQAAGLGQLTTRLLRMARLDRDEIQPRLQVTDLGAVVRRIVDQFQVQVNGHQLAVTIEDVPVDVLSDPDMLGLAILQLLDNSFRYSPPGTTVTIATVVEDGGAMVRVTNQGPPILTEEQHRIFDRFYRGSASRQTSGTGLGLYVARKIVLAHGGALELDTEHRYGKDTTFVLRLPVAGSETRNELEASETASGR